MPQCAAAFDSGRWNSTIFPKQNPNQRDDVLVLDNWITDRFFLCNLFIIDLSGRLVGLSQMRERDDSWSESSAQLAKEQLKILDLGFSELCRQVAIECSQRSELMNRLWQASHEIYEKLLSEMGSAIKTLRESGTEWQRKCEKVSKAIHFA
jgi:hypothetical protein